MIAKTAGRLEVRFSNTPRLSIISVVTFKSGKFRFPQLFFDHNESLQDCEEL